MKIYILINNLNMEIEMLLLYKMFLIVEIILFYIEIEFIILIMKIKENKYVKDHINTFINLQFPMMFKLNLLYSF